MFSQGEITRSGVKRLPSTTLHPNSCLSEDGLQVHQPGWLGRAGMLFSVQSCVELYRLAWVDVPEPEFSQYSSCRGIHWEALLPACLPACTREECDQNNNLNTVIECLGNNKRMLNDKDRPIDFFILINIFCHV